MNWKFIASIAVKAAALAPVLARPIGMGDGVCMPFYEAGCSPLRLCIAQHLILNVPMRTGGQAGQGMRSNRGGVPGPADIVLPVQEGAGRPPLAHSGPEGLLKGRLIRPSSTQLASSRVSRSPALAASAAISGPSRQPCSAGGQVADCAAHQDAAARVSRPHAGARDGAQAVRPLRLARSAAAGAPTALQRHCSHLW